jgi:translation initiation factor 4G
MQGGMQGGTKQGSRGPKPAPRGAPGQHVIQLQISTNIELNKAENAWKPAAQKEKEGSAEHEDPLKELEKNVRSILNKLTPQKFDKLVKQFNELKIDSEMKLANSIELIFEKVRIVS